MDTLVRKAPQLKEIFKRLQETPLPAVRAMLTNDIILRACAEAGHKFREREYGPVATVFHFLLQAIQRDKSYSGTWAELWSNAICCDDAKDRSFNSAGLSQARSRLPREVMERITNLFLGNPPGEEELWRGFRLRALDLTTLSMLGNAEFFAHFGRHKARGKAVRYPLGTLATLLCVGTSSIIGYRFGPHDPGENKTAGPLLNLLGPGDLALADRHFSGAPGIARIQARKADFLMRKNARLIVDRLPVLEKLGRNDFITELLVNKKARAQDPSLPEKVRVRIFRARWRAPSGELLTEWFVTSLLDRHRFLPKTLAFLYHSRWRIETSFLEFKDWFHADVLRGKTVGNVYKEVAAHVLAYQLLRRLILQAAKKHDKKPTEISILHAARWTISFSSRMSVLPAVRLPQMYDRLLDAIASTPIDVRPGRLEPRALTREWKHYPHLRMARSEWRRLRLSGSESCLS